MEILLLILCFPNVNSISSKIASQIYLHKCDFSVSYLMIPVSEEQVGISFKEFISNFRAAYHFNLDRAQVQVVRKTTLMTALKIYEVKCNASQPYNPNKNPAEAII